MTAPQSTSVSFGRLHLALGMLVGLAALIWLGRTIAFVRQAQEAPGKVIRLEGRASGSKPSLTKASSFPVFEFTDAAGGKHVVRSRVGSHPPTFKPGEAVTVLYRPEAPQEARLKSLSDLWLLPSAVAALGVVAIVRCSVLLIRTGRAPATGVLPE